MGCRRVAQGCIRTAVHRGTPPLPFQCLRLSPKFCFSTFGAKRISASKFSARLRQGPQGEPGRRGVPANPPSPPSTPSPPPFPIHPLVSGHRRTYGQAVLCPSDTRPVGRVLLCGIMVFALPLWVSPSVAIFATSLERPNVDCPFDFVCGCLPCAPAVHIARGQRSSAMTSNVPFNRY